MAPLKADESRQTIKRAVGTCRSSLCSQLGSPACRRRVSSVEPRFAARRGRWCRERARGRAGHRSTSPARSLTRRGVRRPSRSRCVSNGAAPRGLIHEGRRSRTSPQSGAASSALAESRRVGANGVGASGVQALMVECSVVVRGHARLQSGRDVVREGGWGRLGSPRSSANTRSHAG
jgi:hypothetical protein